MLSQQIAQSYTNFRPYIDYIHRLCGYFSLSWGNIPYNVGNTHAALLMNGRTRTENGYSNFYCNQHKNTDNPFHHTWDVPSWKCQPLRYCCCVCVSFMFNSAIPSLSCKVGVFVCKLSFMFVMLFNVKCRIYFLQPVFILYCWRFLHTRFFRKGQHFTYT